MSDLDNCSKVVSMAHYILENKTTIRATAQAFNTPKSTVHHELNTRLKYLNRNLYNKVKKLLKQNFETKHIHGGEATKLKYLRIKDNININDEIEATIKISNK